MNFYPFILISLLLITITLGSPVQEDTTRKPDEETTLPTFTVQRLDSPIERIEIRLIDDNTTHSVPEVPEVTQSTVSTTEQVPVEHVHQPDQDPSPASPPDDMYKKVEYVVQPTSVEPTASEPIVIGEDPYYYSTMSSDKQASAEAKAWISVSTSIPKFEGDIDEDDLPPPPASEETEEPEEECLANKEKLTDEVIERLRSETSMYYRLVRQRNEQQKEFCGGVAHDTTSEMYRRCSNWRAEKLVYYYKLMRKTYCQVDNWPNSPKIKKTYGEYLNLFGTFYAFQK
uniref:DUF19 domain-containing protein n=1 Tax=Caenorhabditis tropicalis TaxID=1561998 RepID=A0A1I7SY78_9PELO